MLLETGRKATPVVKWQMILAALCSSLLRKIELVSHETGNSAEEVSKQDVGGAACILLVLLVKHEGSKMS